MHHIIELTTHAWKQALQGLGKVISRKSPLPVLSAIQVTRERGRLSLQTTDLDRFITHHLESDHPDEDVQFLVPFAPLQKAVKDAGKNASIRLVWEGNDEVFIESPVAGQIVRQCHEVPYMDDWPSVPEITVEPESVADGFKSALQQALECSSRDESRYVLRGACLDTTNKGDYVVGTDGRHLYSANSFQFPHRQPAIIPAHKFLTWKAFTDDGDWELGIQTGKDPNEVTHIVLRSSHWTYVTRPIEGVYPNWRQVVPRQSGGTVVNLAAESVSWLQANLPKLPVSDKVTQSVLFAARTEGLHVRASSTETGSVDLPVPEATVAGPEITVALNRSFVLKALKFGFTTLNVNESLDPVLFTAPGRQLVVMPVRQQAQPAPNAATPRMHSSTTTTNERKNNVSATKTPQPKAAKAATQLPGLQAVTEQIEQLRDQVRVLNGGLGEALRSLKEAAKEQRTTEREVNTIRNRLRSLQSVEI